MSCCPSPTAAFCDAPFLSFLRGNRSHTPPQLHQVQLNQLHQLALRLTRIPVLVGSAVAMSSSSPGAIMRTSTSTTYARTFMHYNNSLHGSKSRSLTARRYCGHCKLGRTATLSRGQPGKHLTPVPAVFAIRTSWSRHHNRYPR